MYRRGAGMAEHHAGAAVLEGHFRKDRTDVNENVSESEKNKENPGAKGNRQTGGGKRSGRLRLLAWIVILLLFMISGFMLGRDLWRSYREKSANQRLADQVEKIRIELAQKAQNQPGDAQSGSADGQNGSVDILSANGILLPYDGLWEQNPDMAGWLSLPGAKLSYPVMYTPEDPEYYMRRGFDKNYAVSGSLFIGDGCAPDSTHVIIYGHHMNDGSMFGSLTSYADPEYWKNHPVISYDTLTQTGEYEVMAAFYSRVYTEQDSGVFRYYQYADLTAAERFVDYIRQAKASSLYDTGISAQYGDRILTLSTCSYHTEDGRFVVVAREKKEP